jgi:hypothetical protein
MTKYILSVGTAVCPSRVCLSKDSHCGPIASHDWATNRKLPLRPLGLCGESDFERNQFPPKRQRNQGNSPAIPPILDSSHVNPKITFPLCSLRALREIVFFVTPGLSRAWRGDPRQQFSWRTQTQDFGVRASTSSRPEVQASSRYSGCFNTSPSKSKPL